MSALQAKDQSNRPRCEAAPLPWRLSIRNGYLDIVDAKENLVIADYDINSDPSVGIRVDQDKEVSNFAYIVKACNEYPKLLALIESIKSDCESAMQNRSTANLDFAVQSTLDAIANAEKSNG